MPAHSLLLSSIPSEGRAVFSISLRDLVPSADTRASVASERAIFYGARFVLGDYLRGLLGWLAERG